jgi:hypothetical protein
VFFPLFAHDMKKIKHDSNWLFRMLKCSLGPSLLHFVPRQKKMGRMLHSRNSELQVKINDKWNKYWIKDIWFFFVSLNIEL